MPNPCYSVAAQAQSHERTLTLSLIGTSSAEVCIQVLSSITYESTLTGLTAGAYDLIVVYEYPETGWDPIRMQRSLEARE